MEFETESKSRQPDDVSDETRLSATTKRVTLEPLHTDITPEEPSDAAETGRHVLDPPIANIPTDSENTQADSIAATQPVTTTPLVAPKIIAEQRKRRALPLFIAIGATLLVVVITVAIAVLH